MESGPHRREKLPATVGHAAIRAAADAEFDTVVFSGGESTTYLDDVLDMCREARSRGLRTRLVSNGYWAQTPAAVAEMLERLHDGNVDELVISFDEYHLPYISLDRFDHLRSGTVLAARRPWIIYAAVIEPPGDDNEAASDSHAFPHALISLLTLYGFDIKRCTAFAEVTETLARLSPGARDAYKQWLRDRIIVTWQPLVIGGRATRSLANAVSALPLSAAGDRPCEAAGQQITLPSNGHAYPCCSLWTNFGDHHFGVVGNEAQFADAYRRIRREPLVQLIHAAGPGTLIRWLKSRGVPLRDHYTDICNMCEELFTRCSPERLWSEAALCAHSWLAGGPDDAAALSRTVPRS